MNITYQPSPLPPLTLYASVPDAAEVVAIPASFADANGTWLVQQAAGLSSPDLPVFMLLHADDGVIWGCLKQGTLAHPPPSAWTPPLRSLTVWQCRLFGDLGELFLWREAEGVWRGRKILDSPGVRYQFVTERPFLVGDQVFDSEEDEFGAPLTEEGFTPIIEVATGMRQIVPCAINDGQRARLTVLHYLHEDEDGQSLIKYSRLKHVAAEWQPATAAEVLHG